MADKIFKLEGKVMHYAWGGYDFIPQTLGIQNTERKPFAEYWLGVHPLAMSVVKNSTDKPLIDLVQSSPESVLSEPVFKKFGTLPFLLKIQDVREVLSIQVHPDKKQAEEGFDREDAAGIARDAANRNYKDKNHKPEMAVAVSDFWLLHGFRSADDIRNILSGHESFSSLSEVFDSKGLEALYRKIMTMPQEEVNAILQPVVQKEISDHLSGYTTKHDAAFWIARYFNNQMPEGNIDRGIFSMYLLNIVNLKEGDSIFQAAGILHAYLEGYNVELMSNSDNVLRGGLTPKHIDTEELLNLTRFESVQPHILKADPKGKETVYRAPVDDFSISRIELNANDSYTSHATSIEIHILLKGEASIKADDTVINLKAGESFGVAAGTHYSIAAGDSALLFKAFVP